MLQYIDQSAHCSWQLWSSHGPCAGCNLHGLRLDSAWICVSGQHVRRQLLAVALQTLHVAPQLHAYLPSTIGTSRWHIAAPRPIKQRRRSFPDTVHVRSELIPARPEHLSTACFNACSTSLSNLPYALKVPVLPPHISVRHLKVHCNPRLRQSYVQFLMYHALSKVTHDGSRLMGAHIVRHFFLN